MTPSPVQNSETNSLKAYVNTSLGIQFQYPNSYGVISEDAYHVSLGVPTVITEDKKMFPFVTISRTLTNYSHMAQCTKNNNNTQFSPCATVNDTSDPFYTPFLAGREVKNVSYGGEDSTYHILQTTQSPQIELKMFVSGGGLYETFHTITSTFKFLHE